MLFAMLLLAVTIEPRPGCKFTWDVSDISTVVIPAQAAEACQSQFMQSVSVTGSREDLTIVLTYNVDMLGGPIAADETVGERNRAVAATRGAVRSWAVWHSSFGGVKKFTLKYLDSKSRPLCWFTFTEEAGETPTVSRCVPYVLDPA